MRAASGSRRSLARRIATLDAAHEGLVFGRLDMTAAVDRREGWRAAITEAGLRQDLVALASTQAYFEQGAESFKEVSVRADGAALLARRIIAKLAAQEIATE